MALRRRAGPRVQLVPKSQHSNPKRQLLRAQAPRVAVAPETSTFDLTRVNFQAPSTTGFKWGGKARDAKWGPQSQNVKTVGPPGARSKDGWLILVDADNCAGLLKLVDQWSRRGGADKGKSNAREVHLFCGRHLEIKVVPYPLRPYLHRANSGLRDSADHFVSFFVGMYGKAWAANGTRLAVISRDDALENAVLLYRSEFLGDGRFISASTVTSISDLNRALAPHSSQAMGGSSSVTPLPLAPLSSQGLGSSSSNTPLATLRAPGELQSGTGESPGANIDELRDAVTPASSSVTPLSALGADSPPPAAPTPPDATPMAPMPNATPMAQTSAEPSQPVPLTT